MFCDIVGVAHPDAVAVGQCQVFRVLGQDVAVLPVEHGLYVLQVVQAGVIDVERHPVPSLGQVDGLQVHVVGIHQHRVVHGACDGLLGKRHGWRCRDLHGLARGVVPEAEEEQVAHCRAVVGGEVEHAAACGGVVVDVVHAHAVAVGIEGGHLVALVGDEYVVQIDLCHDVHRVALALRGYRPLRSLALDGEFQEERLAHALLVGHVDDLVVGAYVQVLAHGEDHVLLVHRLNLAAHFVNGEPARQVVDGEGVGLAALVHDIHLYRLLHAGA